MFVFGGKRKKSCNFFFTHAGLVYYGAHSWHSSIEQQTSRVGACRFKCQMNACLGERGGGWMFGFILRLITSCSYFNPKFEVKLV